MIEKLIVLEDIDPVIFYGVNNANMQLIKALYPKLRIVARGNVPLTLYVPFCISGTPARILWSSFCVLARNHTFLCIPAYSCPVR